MPHGVPVYLLILDNGLIMVCITLVWAGNNWEARVEQTTAFVVLLAKQPSPLHGG